MATLEESFAPFAEKMRGAGMSPAALAAFRHNYGRLLAGDTGLIPEAEIEPVHDLPRFDDLVAIGEADPTLLAQTAVLKLNGGLGTSMGLERAKSLLPVKDGLTFLDFIARQILFLRRVHGPTLHFLVMNSFSTSRDTLEFLRRYPELGDPADLELMQSQIPKVDAKTLQPSSWPENPQLEWCPPGHGDIYPSLLGSGWLERLLQAGVRYLFTSNSDNLGATLDPRLLSWFAASGYPFVMEVAARTPSDRKGGHIARRPGAGYLLRETAQCPPADLPAMQDVERHKYFNTNSLWMRLDRLRDVLQKSGGLIPLPLIKNSKTLDPRKKDSPLVFQLETAMGAAIQCFPDSEAIIVPRFRFAPVKTTSDLLTLRSDAYQVSPDARLVPAPGNSGPPDVILEAAHYQMVDQLDEKLADGIPSLRQCQTLTIRGPVRFSSKTVFRGVVTVSNRSSEAKLLPAGEYADREIEL